MIRVIASPDVLQGKADGRWRIRAAAFVVGGTAAGVACGAVLGALGGLMSTPVRSAVVALGALFMVTMALFEVLGRRPPLVQWDRETPRRWLWLHHLLGPALTAAWLGTAVSTRIGYALVYVVPLGAFWSAEPVAGAAVFGAYGLSRALAAVGIVAFAMRAGSDRLGRGMERIGPVIFARGEAARGASGLLAIVVGVGVLTIT